MRKIQIAIMAATLVMAVEARATLYDIGFTASDNSVLMDGTVDVNGLGLATSGSMTVFVGPGALPTGSYALVPTGQPAGTVVTAPVIGGWQITFDNMVFPNVAPFLDTWGLYFSNGQTVLQMNLWGNNAGNNGYEFMVLATSGNPAVDVLGGASISAVPVPEPTTMIAGALLLLPFGASTLRMLRRNRTA